MKFLLMMMSLLLLVPAAFGQEASQKIEIDLSKQFAPFTKLQKGGTCHVHAATSLLESLCFRRLGHPVSLSADLFVYLHLRKILKQADFSAEAFTKPLTRETNGYVQSTGENFWIDGGWPDDSLRAAQQGAVCGFNELSLNPNLPEQVYRLIDLVQHLDYMLQSKCYDFDDIFKFIDAYPLGSESEKRRQKEEFESIKAPLIEYLQKNISNFDSLIAERDEITRWLKGYEESSRLYRGWHRDTMIKKNDRKREISDIIHPVAFKYFSDYSRKAICETLDGAVKCSYQLPIDSALNFSKNEDVKECFEKPFEIKREPYDAAKAIKLLKAGVPYICIGDHDFKERKVKPGQSHASLRIGYSRNGEREGWHHRDSAIGLSWFTGDCKEIIYIQ